MPEFGRILRIIAAVATGTCHNANDYLQAADPGTEGQRAKCEEQSIVVPENKGRYQAQKGELRPWI